MPLVKKVKKTLDEFRQTMLYCSSSVSEGTG